jgi:hypothetical protein
MGMTMFGSPSRLPVEEVDAGDRLAGSEAAGSGTSPLRPIYVRERTPGRAPFEKPEMWPLEELPC